MAKVVSRGVYYAGHLDVEPRDYGCTLFWDSFQGGRASIDIESPEEMIELAHILISMAAKIQERE